jgi:monovalent cation/hydrogen antiporter
MGFGAVEMGTCMPAIEQILLMVSAAVVLGMLARWLRQPYPILLVLGGLLISLQPDAPKIALEPSLVFVLFLPPLLYAGAFNTQWALFRMHLRPILMLAFGLVFFSMSAVAYAAHTWCGLPWAEAFLLGAIVSPPDAVAAMAVGRLVKLPPTVVTILEGESLVNDAAALVAYRIALVWVMSGTFSWNEAGEDLLIASLGGVAFGIAAAIAVIKLHSWIERRDLVDAKLSITITLLSPYAIYIPAEHMHVSGVLAVVAAGMWVGHRAERIFANEFFVEAKAVWEWIEFLLNSFVFILIGLQLPVVIDALDNERSPAELAGLALIVIAATILARLVWMLPGAYLPRWLDRKLFGWPTPYPPVTFVIVTAWTGMRGVVSLAAALALPMTRPDGAHFEHRNMILFLTFWVIFATLVGQGLTLPWLVRGLGVDRHPLNRSDEPVNHSTC